MKGNKAWVILGMICLVSLLVPLAVSCAAPTPAPTTSKTFDLGVLEGVSGMFSEYTKQNYDGIPIAIEIINERGGITVNGQKYLINPIFEDSKNSPDGVVSAANKLVNDYKVKFIVGTAMGAFAQSELTVTNPAGVVTSQVWNNGAAADCSAKTPLVLKATGGTVEAAAALVKYLRMNYPEVKTLLNIMPDDGAIPDVGPKVAKLAEAAGLTMTGDTFGWGLDTVDFYPLAQQCMARKADAWLVSPGYEGMVTNFLKAGREQGYNGVVMANTGAFYNLAKAAGNDPKVLTRVIMPGFSTESVEELRALPDDMFTPLFKQIGEKAFAKYGFYNGELLKGFDCTYCLIQAIEKAQSFDPAVVAATWKKMGTMETSWGTGQMCGLETFGVINVCAPKRPIQVIDNGVMKYAGMADMSVP